MSYDSIPKSLAYIPVPIPTFRIPVRRNTAATVKHYAAVNSGPLAHCIPGETSCLVHRHASTVPELCIYFTAVHDPRLDLPLADHPSDSSTNCLNICKKLWRTTGLYSNHSVNASNPPAAYLLNSCTPSTVK